MAYRQRLTDAGRDVIALGQTGLLVTFTRVVLGEGEAQWEHVPEMTELIEPVMEAPIVSIARTEVGQVTITARISLNQIPRDFWLNEIGVFATVGSEPEVLYAVSIADAAPNGISKEMGGGSTSEHTIKIAVIVGATEDVTAIFDPEIEVINIGTSQDGAGWFANRIGNQFRFRRAAVTAPLTMTEEANVVRFGIAAVVPTGGMIPFAGAIGMVPAGWLGCDGAWYSKAEFPALAAVLGNQYGGDVNNFAVPNLADRTLIGASATRPLASMGGSATHTLTVAELASHGHSIYDPGHEHPIWIGEHGHNYADPGHGHATAAHTHTFTWVGRDSNVQLYFHQMPQGTGGIREYIGHYSSETAVGQVLLNAAAVGVYGSGIGIVISNAIVPAAVQRAYPTQYGMAISANGSNQPHNNMQPYLAVNYIIRT